MKKLFLQMLITVSSLFPLTQIQAATFGGFAPGKTFTFTVKTHTSQRIKGSTVTQNVAIPTGIPKFANGQKIKFTIGAKGQLTGPGFSIPFKTGTATENDYAKPLSGTLATPDTSLIYKSAPGTPMGVLLFFYKQQLSGAVPVINAVEYTLL